MTTARRSFPPALQAAAIAACLVAWLPASAQIPNSPGYPIGTPLGSPGAVDAVQPPPPAGRSAEEADDPPGRVGRIADVSGQVWLYHPDSGEWVSADRNRPLTSGDRIATDGGGRAEVRIGSTTLRLDGGSELEVERLDDEQTSLRLHNGSLAVRLRSNETLREFELLTGEGRFIAQRTGRYRFDRNDDTSHVTVYAGQALYEGPGSALTVNANQRAEFWLDNQNAAQYSITDPVRDAFAGWNSERDRADDRSASTRYVSPEMTGVEDLDRYGRWEQSPDYGSLWIPRTVAPGWAPYSTGRWAWVRPWGWTWVDDAPWGFAPFHYGRWVYVRNTWCWAPGTYVRRPVYAPALVAWIGGPRLSVSINVGGGPGPAVGWLPLAPREVYVPGYRVSPRYVRNVNVTHVTNITNITTIVNNPQAAVGQRDYGNRKFPHAVTVVPSSVLTSRQPVRPAADRLRDTPDVRRFVDEPTRVAAIVAPPVARPSTTPALPYRRGESPLARPVSPAGVAAAPATVNVAPPPPGRVRPPSLPAATGAAPGPSRGVDGRGEQRVHERREPVPPAVARPVAPQAVAPAVVAPVARPAPPSREVNVRREVTPAPARTQAAPAAVVEAPQHGAPRAEGAARRQPPPAEAQQAPAAKGESNRAERDRDRDRERPPGPPSRNPSMGSRPQSD